MMGITDNGGRAQKPGDGDRTQRTAIFLNADREANNIDRGLDHLI
jgi:hypothetical protein